ncbi:uncharacterized protein si:ch211-214j8.12 [Trichomycterus rosablanca]|uniref:uncharacterized protein si:ch211-214j8.12 n=1 Tax=Trichomycterus rosablanca TaxID=2290929 RepID=UPI002F34FAC8
MPLFRQPEVRSEREKQKPKKRNRKHECDEDEDPSSLRRLCILNLAENMKEVWTQDYAQNYMDRYFFRYIMGPFSLLPGDLIEELLYVLSKRNLISRAALHLLLLPQLNSLSLSRCSNLVTANLCALVSARCQSLKSLDLSGALNVSPSALCSLLSGLSRLQSLSLSGTPCDPAVISTIARECPALHHLDVSRCLRLRPGSLLPLGCRGQNRLSSLLATDIGMGEGEIDACAAAAFLMLGVPGLRRLASEGVGGACEVFENKAFDLTEGFTCRQGVPGLKELWDRRIGGNTETECVQPADDSFTLEEELGGLCLDKTRGSEEKTGEFGSRSPDTFKLRLREVQGVSLKSLQAVANLCPELSSISLNCHDDFNDESETRSTLLTQGLERWSGRLLSLSLQFPGPLSDLVPALEASGSSLRHLTLEGVQADGNLPFLALVRACPKLNTLVVHIDPPPSNQEYDDDDDEGIEDWSLPCLPDLQTLTLNFSLDERQLRPVLCWTALKGVLWSLLRGAPHLHALSLVAAPCRLDPVFRLVLGRHTEPLRRLRHVSLKRSDVTAETATRLVHACGRLATLDVSGCRSMSLSNVNKLESRARRRRHRLQITWT